MRKDEITSEYEAGKRTETCGVRGALMVVARGSNKFCQLFPNLRSAPESITGANMGRRATVSCGFRADIYFRDAASQGPKARDGDQLIELDKSTALRRPQ
jgi:hypothetical protein